MCYIWATNMQCLRHNLPFFNVKQPQECLCLTVENHRLLVLGKQDIGLFRASLGAGARQFNVLVGAAFAF
jgi:hypothetical protein